MNSVPPGESTGTEPSEAALSPIGAVVSLLLPAIAVAALILLMFNVQNRTQSTMATFSELLPLGYAFGAGMIASVNPCGFFLLPSYASYQLGVDEAGYASTRASRRIARALILTGLATAGFVVLFGSVGGVFALGGTWLTRWFPYAGIVVGVAMTLLGVWLLVSGRTLSMRTPGRMMVTPKRNQRNVFLFGIGYALASLCCTLPIFLVVVGTGIASGSMATAVSQFISYALGMGLILAVVTVGTSLARDGVSAKMRSFYPYVKRTSNMFLIAAGLYIIYYWVFYADFFF